MKKLLLGALLVVTGAMSFGQSITEVSGTGNGSLSIESRGEVVDLANGKTYLVITPKVNAGPEGNNLIFDHTQIAKGEKGAELAGTYEAKVLKGTSDGKGTELEATFTSILTGTAVTGDASKATITVNNANSEKLGTLTYNLVSQAAEETKTHVGKVVSQFDAKEAAGTGTFVDRSVSVQVSVTSIQDV